ncbi:MAG: YCF48-related protein [Planctomycetota bacterium]
MTRGSFWSLLAALVMLVLGGCASGPPRARAPVWTPQQSGVDASLRGVCAVDDAVAWASGSAGTVLRTQDGGAHWQRLTVAGALDLDFRDVHATSAERAWLLTAGTPARVYRTDDGGSSWHVQHEESSPAAFFDAFAWWDDRAGLAFSDPVDGAFLVLRTADGGATWTRASSLPVPRLGEAGFAASGTCVAVGDHGRAWIGTGGTVARVLRSTDRGATWQAAATPLQQGEASQGVFSIAFVDANRGVAVGGDYTAADSRVGTAAWTDDGGHTWRAAATPPWGYRSCVVPVPSAGGVWISVGPNGIDRSLDDGEHWQALGAAGHHALALAPSGAVGWAVGAAGRITRLDGPGAR